MCERSLRRSKSLITVDQSKVMAEALVAAGTPYHLLLLDDSPGDETREALRLRYYRNLEAFFFQHLGSAAAAAPVAAAP